MSPTNVPPHPPVATTDALYQNNGDGTFTAILTGELVNESGAGQAAAWADYDNDGFHDVYVTNTLEASLFRNSAMGFSKVMGIPTFSFNLDLNFISAAWGDYDADGYLDLFATRFSDLPAHRNALYRNNGNGTFLKLPDNHPTVKPSTSSTPSWIDYDNNGTLDLFVGNYANRAFLFNNLGSGNFQDVAANAGLNAYGQAASWADYDNDGDFDVFLNYNELGSSLFFDNSGAGNFKQNPMEPPPFQANSISWGDFDNDGWIDFAAVTCRGTNKKYLFRNNGNKTFTEVSSAMGFSDVSCAAGLAAADYNKDGFLDLFIPNSDGDATNPSGNDFLYQNTPNSNHWIQLNLTGTNSNRSAIGSVVRAIAAGKHQMRTIQSTTGSNSQNSLTVHFGLGSASKVDTLQVEWPQRGYQEFYDHAIDDFFTISEINFPNAPSNLIASSTVTGVALQWVDNSSTETGFRIERTSELSPFYKVIATVPSNTTSFIDSEIPLGTWKYRVAAMTSGGFSTFSNQTIITGSEKNSVMASVYPNPVTRYLTIRRNEPRQEKLEVYDVTGRIIETHSIFHAEETVDLGALTTGLYILQMGQSRFKMIKL